MKKNRLGGLLSALILVLPMLDCVLLRLVVRSILDDEPEIGLFFLFCLQFVPQEILLRSLFGKKGPRRWYYWASWICRWSLILIAVFSAAHLLMGHPWETLLLPDLYKSRLWVDLAQIPLRWISGICGIVLALGRKELRKKILHVFFFAMPACMFLLGIFSPAMKDSRLFSDLLGNVYILFIPVSCAVMGALFVPLFGKRLQAEEEKAAQAREQAKKTEAARSSVPNYPGAPSAALRGKAPAPAQPSPVPVIPNPLSASARPAPAPAQAAPAWNRPRQTGSTKPGERDIEKELVRQKLEYEARLRQREEEKKRTLEEVPSGKMLETVAGLLFSEGSAAASLGGQRQLVYWMAQAVPRLSGLIRQPVGRRFYAPQLADEPGEFMPVLDALLFEAVRLLQSRDEAEERECWQSADPETLCAGWYALTRFADLCQEGSVLQEEAERLEAHFKKNRTCSAWLTGRYQAAAEEGEAWNSRR